MFRRSLAGLAGLTTLLVLVGCGGPSPSILPSGPTASSVAVQPSDLPPGIKKCDQSGDIDSFLGRAKAKDPTSYNTIKPEWEAAKKQGATASYAAFYTDSTAHCASVETNAADITAASYKLVVNFVIQFKDEASAVKGYTSESIFGVSSQSLKSGGAPVVEGIKTGLSANSIVLTVAVSTQSYYVAVWQNKDFMVILAILNIDAATDKRIALAANGRIK